MNHSGNKTRILLCTNAAHERRLKIKARKEEKTKPLEVEEQSANHENVVTRTAGDARLLRVQSIQQIETRGRFRAKHIQQNARRSQAAQSMTLERTKRLCLPLPDTFAHALLP